MNRNIGLFVTLLTIGALGHCTWPGRVAASTPASHPATASAPAAAPTVKVNIDTSALPPAPDFKVPNLGGKHVSLSDFRGKLVLLNFWSVSCNACRLEVPDFMDLQRLYGPKGLQVIAISREEKEEIELFARARLVTYELLLGTADVERAFNVHDTPTTFMITPDGKIYEKYVGVKPRETFETDVKLLLGITPWAGRGLR